MQRSVYGLKKGNKQENWLTCVSVLTPRYLTFVMLALVGFLYVDIYFFVDIVGYTLRQAVDFFLALISTVKN